MENVYKKHYKKTISVSNYNRVHLAIRENLNKELNKILNFKDDYQFWFYERRFEKDFAKYCGKKYGIGLCSGTAALQFSLFASGIKHGDEVITTPFTYIATALSIYNIGAKPVFVDIDPRTFTIDVDKIEDSITERTKAILPVHIYGHPCEMGKIMKIAKKYELAIIEDCAQACGSLYKKKKVPFTNLGCFSFHTSKILGGLGDGGIAVTNIKEVDRIVNALRDPVSNDNLLKFSKRTPSFLDSIQIAFLKSKLPFLDEWIEKRRQIAKFYNEELEKTSVETPYETADVKHSYFRYTVKSKNRNKLKRFLFKHGVDTGTEHYELHLAKIFQDSGHKRGDFPMTEECNRRVLYLPINQFLKEGEITKIARLIKLFDKK